MATLRSPADLSALLKGRRLALGETQAQFAARVGRTQGWVSTMERDGIPNVYASTMLEVLAAAGITLTLAVAVPGREPAPSASDPEGDFATGFEDDEGPFPGMLP